MGIVWSLTFDFALTAMAFTKRLRFVRGWDILFSYFHVNFLQKAY
jgi:hypothetical protein